LCQIVRREVGVRAAALVAGVLAQAVLQSPLLSGRASALAEVESLDSAARIDPTSSRWRDDLFTIINAALTVRLLPALPTLAGADSRCAATAGEPANAALLAKIRALLAKAESTEFAEEAEAFTLKASELMTRHRIDSAALESGHEGTRRDGVVSRRVWLEDPYVPAKGFLLAVVARANGGTSVRMDLGFSIVLGLAEDIDLVEVLFTSLLVQATRQMTVAGRRAGQRTAPFRRSFLLAYATRISARLEEANRQATEAAKQEIGDSFLPVLARRREDVDDAVDRLVGKKNLRTTRFTASDRAGWSAGTAAADLADLGTRSVLGAR
jgi:hypothetical protein